MRPAAARRSPIQATANRTNRVPSDTSATTQVSIPRLDPSLIRCSADFITPRPRSGVPKTEHMIKDCLMKANLEKQPSEETPDATRTDSQDQEQSEIRRINSKEN